MRPSTSTLFRIPFAALLALCAPGVALAEDLKAAVTAADAHWASTFATHDAHALALVYSADGQILAAGSDPVTGTAAIQKFVQGVLDEGVATVELATLEVFGQGRHATAIGRYAMKDKAGKEVDHGKYMELWRLEKGTWRLHRDMFTSSVPPKK